MPRLVYTARALADLERVVDFLQQNDPAAAMQTYDLIESALNILTRHPLVGRPAEQGLRELVISRGATGYIALYRFNEALDEAMVLAVRHQREAGYE
ncbi:MAG TPA: type II toxin-antitoxin system RelE/ParE family toxin [Methylophilaceae bacterium]|nr:type II toxin-antitoxin system RelE/ParE family toxin [Methylophilaceae bacterium]HQR60505.1 type II toxin-antitoxin system RelE/ParE family toxin [Methylophilaceae bacterium]